MSLQPPTLASSAAAAPVSTGKTNQPHKLPQSATLFPRFRAFKNIVLNDAGQSFIKDIDFAVQRVNYQGDEGERHRYQSFRALRPFLIFTSFSAVSCGTITLTKVLNLRQQWPLGRHFKFCLFMGMTAAVMHYHFGTPFEIRHLLTTPDSSYTNLAYAVLSTRDDRDDWITAFNLAKEPPKIERKYFAVPNFQHSGNTAIVTMKPRKESSPKQPAGPYAQADAGIPTNGVEIDPDEIFLDIALANQLYHTSRESSPFMRPQGSFDETKAEYLQNQSIASYCALHDIPMPQYYEQFEAFRAENVNVARPVNFLHMYSEDDAKVRGHLPLAFQSPYDIQSVNEARTQLQKEVDDQARAMWRLQEAERQQAKEQGQGTGTI